ncbi:MAG: hypothetical protein COB67_00060 [SAR324 cluster bacterium]|uniref:Uncharacterized protein n=1 Tax=SAR324 cluster bacterium TaxID=2024889 RepID=A0A2A4TBG7_9DELT|nr:MAG: hypothetical protein COB67_00060 [SAR324 cluster bacterium]
MKTFKLNNQPSTLCDLAYTVNDGVVITKEGVLGQNLGREVFKISSPTIFSISLTRSKYLMYSNILMTGSYMHSMTFYPKGYIKGQKEDKYDLRLDLGFINNVPTVQVIDFGSSFGKLRINNIEVGLSHASGPNGDYTDIFCLVGSNAHAALNELLEHLMNPNGSNAMSGDTLCVN